MDLYSEKNFYYITKILKIINYFKNHFFEKLLNKNQILFNIFFKKTFHNFSNIITMRFKCKMSTINKMNFSIR